MFAIIQATIVFIFLTLAVYKAKEDISSLRFYAYLFCLMFSILFWKLQSIALALRERRK